MNDYDPNRPQENQSAPAPEPVAKPKPSYDLDNFDTVAAASVGAWLILRHPNTDEKLVGENGPWRIQLLGNDSKKFKRAISFEHEQAAKSRKKVMSLEKRDESGINALAAITLEFENIVMGEEIVSFSRENAIMLYTRFPWIKEQVDEFTAERSNFLKSAPTS